MPSFLKRPADAAGSTVVALMTGLFVAFGGVLFGYDIGIISGIIAMPYFQTHFSTGYRENGQLTITAGQQSLIVSILSVGTFVGALLSSVIADHIGRRKALMVDSCVFIFGNILQTASTSIPLLLAGRFFAGFGVGLLSATIPLYQAETAPKWIRGSIIGCYQLCITIGMFTAGIVNNATKSRNDTGSYRIPIAVQFLFALIIIFGSILLPETPRQLVRQGKYEQAAKSLSRLRRLDADHPAIVEELAEIRGNHEYELALGPATYLTCFRKPIRKRLIAGICLQALQQLTGINFIFYYGTTFFQRSGISDPFLITVVCDVCNIVGTIPGLYLVEKWGRRPLLIMGAIGMAVCEFICGAIGVTLPNSTTANSTVIAFVCIYIVFFELSWGPCAWVVTGEIFPLKSRAKALGMTSSSNWLLNWALAYATPFMVNSGKGNANLGSKVFFIWGSLCVLCAVFVHFFIYETKGLSLEQVDELYEKVPRAWKSAGFVPTVSFAEVQQRRSSFEEDKGGVVEQENSVVESE
ncbi:Plasma membrane low glucose sensor [Exophiala sp. CCFEE 6388]|uniref:Plasma membrane low glucose sensor n=1 Tax=Exophiala sideris TaxID=1016849 RepID=A0ABR0JDL7_9EURO|nr:Plasma membrane low glucose sensor [Exophiala sideris]KAK5184460.1 Plasma membrane low glucose sensor [Eurotiomycetes sp. CCFEE 6388]